MKNKSCHPAIILLALGEKWSHYQASLQEQALTIKWLPCWKHALFHLSISWNTCTNYAHLEKFIRVLSLECAVTRCYLQNTSSFHSVPTKDCYRLKGSLKSEGPLIMLSIMVFMFTIEENCCLIDRGLAFFFLGGGGQSKVGLAQDPNLQTVSYAKRRQEGIKSLCMPSPPATHMN